MLSLESTIMLRKNNFGSTVKVLIQSGKYFYISIFFLLTISSQSITLAQPVTSGGLDNEIYFEDVQTANNQPADPSELNYPVEKSYKTQTRKSPNGLLMIVGAIFFGFLTLLFLKIAAKNKVILLIIGILTLMILNANAQPQTPEVNNQAYFGETSGKLGPEPTSTMSTPPPPGVPIDSGLAILAIAGLSVGIYGIYIQSRKSAEI